MKLKSKIVYLFLIIFTVALIGSYSQIFALANDIQAYHITDYNYEDNSLLISTNNSETSTDSIRSLFKDYSVVSVKNLSPYLKTNIFKVQFSFHNKEKILDLINLYSDVKGIDCIEPDYYLCEVGATANDSYYGSQWGLSDIGIEKAWDITTGSHNIRVGVIDTGVYKHTDLDDNLAEGWNFVDDNNDTTDTNGHGTHVAGIIGAVGDNNKGISGVNKCVTIVPLKISHLGSESLSVVTSRVINAIDYAQSFYGTANEIQILNMSWWNFGNDQLLRKAIDDFSGLFVCIAGNGSQDIDVKPNFPGSFNIDNMITVGAIDSDGKKRETSNYGKISVDLFAPGGEIWSTLPNNEYGYKSGTSMAAPHVAGVAALIYAKCPDITASEVKKFILNNVDKVDDLKEVCVTGGRLNAYKAVNAAHTTDHTPAYHFRNEQQHEVYCDFCKKDLGLEKHNFIPRYKSRIAVLPDSWICNECRCVKYKDGGFQIIYGLEDEVA